MMLRVVSSAGTSRAGTLRWQVRTPNPDYETRLARRSAAHRTPLHPGGRPDSRRPFRQHRNRPTYNEKPAVSPGAIPECEHPRDWVAEGAVSSEPVSPRFWASARRLLSPRLARAQRPDRDPLAHARIGIPVYPGKSRDLFFGSRVVLLQRTARYSAPARCALSRAWHTRHARRGRGLGEPGQGAHRPGRCRAAADRPVGSARPAGHTGLVGQRGVGCVGPAPVQGAEHRRPRVGPRPGGGEQHRAPGRSALGHRDFRTDRRHRAGGPPPTERRTARRSSGPCIAASSRSCYAVRS